MLHCKVVFFSSDLAIKNPYSFPLLSSPVQSSPAQPRLPLSSKPPLLFLNHLQAPSLSQPP